jgi:hypothetical protein
MFSGFTDFKKRLFWEIIAKRLKAVAERGNLLFTKV